jgi:hypothetical protein
MSSCGWLARRHTSPVAVALALEWTVGSILLSAVPRCSWALHTVIGRYGCAGFSQFTCTNRTLPVGGLWPVRQRTPEFQAIALGRMVIGTTNRVPTPVGT